MRATASSKTARVERDKPPDWSELLLEAVTKPGVISAAYSRFWNYSVGNQLLAMFQCMERRIELGPIHTFRGWHDLGRHVKKGERALTLCMPVNVKRSAKHVARTNSEAAESSAAGDSKAEPGRLESTIFVYRRNWFVLAQTEGSEYVPLDVRAWSEERALDALKVQRVAFTHPDGNCQGYAREREIAVSPIAFLHHRTLFHELAHVVTGHTAELTDGLTDADERTPRNIREVEAECVALICCESLGLCGSEFSRGYVQHWLQNERIEEKSAQRIFRSADAILRAGRPAGDHPSTD